MSYIDNKHNLIREIHILELENELLRTKIKQLQNELLDCTKPNNEQTTLQRAKTRKPNNRERL
jgi:regulator of replication initiation timing